MNSETITVELVDGLIAGKTEDAGERGLLLRLVRGFDRGESSRWAMAQIEKFTSDLPLQRALMSATIDLINLRS